MFNKVLYIILTEVFIIIFAILILIFGGFNMSQLSMGQSSYSLQIPMGYLYFTLPLSGAITVVYSVLNIHKWLKF